MFGNIEPTPFDLRFSIFGIPVRVHPFFWVVSAMMGWNPDQPQFMLMWIGCVFISILVHELGHALSAQNFGWPPQIVMYSFGGLAMFSPGYGYTTARAILILLAGPGAGFLLYGAVLLTEQVMIRLGVRPTPMSIIFFYEMEWINLWWGLVNLLPVYPLDGGQITRHLLSHWRPRDGVDLSLKISLLTAGGIAAFFFQRDMKFEGIMFAMLAFQSYQAMQDGGRYYR